MAQVIGLHVNPQGGVPKHPVDTLEVSLIDGISGDRQNDLKHHGGPQRAICLMQWEVMKELQDAGHPIFPGSTGENLLIKGLDVKDFYVGSVLSVGSSVIIEITSDAPPCKTIRESFANGVFKALSHTVQPQKTRWYARIKTEGAITMNDEVHAISGSEQVGSQ